MDDKTWDPTSKCYQKNASVPKGNQVFSHKGPELLRKGGILHPNSHKFPLSLGCLILPFEAPFSNAYWCVSRREWMGMGVAGMTNSYYGSFPHSLRSAPFSNVHFPMSIFPMSIFTSSATSDVHQFEALHLPPRRSLRK